MVGNFLPLPSKQTIYMLHVHDSFIVYFVINQLIYFFTSFSCTLAWNISPFVVVHYWLTVQYSVGIARESSHIRLRSQLEKKMKSFAFLLLLFATVKKGQSEIKCELKSGVNSALNKVGSAALRGIYFHENRNSQNMHLMDCYCVDEDVSPTFPK